MLYLMADLSISPETLVVFTTVVGGLWSTLVVLWRADTNRRNDRERSMQRQLDDLIRVLIERGLRDQIPGSVHHRDIPPRDANGR
jgi:hypothetical protein